MVGVERDVRDLVDAVERLKQRGYEMRVTVDNGDLFKLAKKLGETPGTFQLDSNKWAVGFWVGRCFFMSEGSV